MNEFFARLFGRKRPCSPANIATDARPAVPSTVARPTLAGVLAELKQALGNDPVRMHRALAHLSGDLTLSPAAVIARLAGEDRCHYDELKNRLVFLEAENAELKSSVSLWKQRFQDIRDSGHPGALNLSATAGIGAPGDEQHVPAQSEESAT